MSQSRHFCLQPCRRGHIPPCSNIRFSSPLLARITVRQTRDPFDANIEYIAYCKMSYESNGGLNMKGMSIGTPGTQYVIQFGETCWLSLKHDDYLPACNCPLYIRNTKLGPVMTIIETNDADAAIERRHRQLIAERRAERIAAMKGFFIGAGSWIASPFRAAASFEKRGIQALVAARVRSGMIHRCNCSQ